MKRTTQDSGGDGPAPYALAAPPNGEPVQDAGADFAMRASAQTQDRLWWAAGVLYRRRWWIVVATILAAAGAVALTLSIPNKYRATTNVLLPEGGTDLFAGALSSISPSAAALIGGGGAGFERYMAILTSPTTIGQVVDQFELVRVYDLGEEPHPRESAVAQLYERATFDVSLDFDYLAVSVLDEDPERAAQMANFFVERLNERNIDLTSSSAATNRRFLDRRLKRAYAELDSAQAALQSVQERSGVIDPGAQAEALMASLGMAEGQVALAESQYQALLSQYPADNAEVAAARAALQSARAQSARLSSGGGDVLPLPVRQLPRVQRQYAQAQMEIIKQTQIIETIQPLYEQAALQEQRDADAVQILDIASPPVKKAEPKRAILVIAATLSALLIVAALTLTLAALRRTGPSVLARLRAVPA